jgi:hypothetical protein
MRKLPPELKNMKREAENMVPSHNDRYGRDETRNS